MAYRLEIGTAVLLLSALPSLNACARPENGGAPSDVMSQTQLLRAHDPAMIHDGEAYYLFSTGSSAQMPIAVRRSVDGTRWTDLRSPIKVSEWARKQVPSAGGYWAPDIAKVEGGYRLYYSVSSFGSNRSAIGFAKTASLNPSDPEHGWRDVGLVLSSQPGDDFNAIDPNLFVDGAGRHLLSFGSFWGGIMQIELDPATGLPLASSHRVALAHRPDDPDHALEAPFIFERDGYYYLLAAIDHCCRGADSDYKIIIGRARSTSGPYVDRNGTPMLDGGGTVIAEAKPDERFQGPGHPAFLHARDGRDILVYHAYDADNGGVPTLQIGELVWSDGWPTVLTGTILP